MEHLKAICAIADAGSFSIAADRLCISQPALSVQIRQLEQDCAQVLFETVGRRKQLTAAGLCVLFHARIMLGQVVGLRADLQAMHGLSQGSLVVAAGDMVTRRLLVQALADFCARYPAIRLQVWNRTSREALAMVQDGQADLAFITLPVSDTSLEISFWQSFGWVAVGAPQATFDFGSKSELSLRELQGQTLLLLEHGSRLRTLVDERCQEYAVQPDHIMELGSVDLQIDCARACMGIAIIPAYALTKLDQAGLLVCDLPDMGIGKLGIGARGHYQSPASKAFLHLLIGSSGA